VSGCCSSYDLYADPVWISPNTPAIPQSTMLGVFPSNIRFQGCRRDSSVNNEYNGKNSLLIVLSLAPLDTESKNHTVVDRYYRGCNKFLFVDVLVVFDLHQGK